MRNYSIFFLIILIIFILIAPYSVRAEEEDFEPEDIILQQLEKINLSDLQKEVDRINQKVEGYLPDLDLKGLILGFVRGELELNWVNLIQQLINYFGREVVANFYILGQIILLAVVSAVLSIFHDSFSSKTISNTANILVFLILSVLILQAFQLAINIGVEVIDNMVSFMQALVPVLLSLLVGMGAITSAAIFHPLTFLIISFFSNVARYVVLPMIFISAILSIVSEINIELSLSRLAALFREISLGLLGLILIIFIGGLLLQGGAAAVTDSLSLRTAKYLTGTFIPVIGGVFSDAVDLIVGCSLIIKNALNIFGFLVIISVIAYPLLKIIALLLIYKVSSALIQPIADKRLVNILNKLGNCLVLVFIVVSAVSLMFFVVLTIITGTANLTVMMR
ncbi:MAG TPA: stage III sporulation protein AE [Halanaerobiales bacterium]|nr:stage III sporulation protein AE [Halanaerobiales bacterium]